MAERKATRTPKAGNHTGCHTRGDRREASASRAIGHFRAPARGGGHSAGLPVRRTRRVSRPVRARTRWHQKPSKTNYWRQTMSNPAKGWTPERRKRQSEAIRRWKPWQQSSGPKSPEGRAVVALNAWTGGHGAQLRELSKMVKEQVQASRELVNSCCQNKQ